MESEIKLTQNDLIALKLHDRSTRGETLTTQEQSMLDAWYAEQDAIEMATTRWTSSDELAKLRLQLADTLQNLTTSTERLRAISAENEQLRLQNRQLEERLIQRLQPA